MTRTFRPFRPFRPIARALLAAGALCAAAAASAGPLVFHYTAVGTDGSAITGSFGWNADAVPTFIAPGGTNAVYNDSPAHPLGGFLKGTVSGGVYDGAVVSYDLPSWSIMDNADGVGSDGLVSTSSESFIMLIDVTGAALDGGVNALPGALNVADWGDEHRGRFTWSIYEQLDFTLTSITRADAVAGSVPEPGSLALAGLAATAGAVVRRKRRAAGQSAGAASPSPRAGT